MDLHRNEAIPTENGTAQSRSFNRTTSTPHPSAGLYLCKFSCSNRLIALNPADLG